MDLERKKFTKEIAGRELIIEASRLAEQANAALMATCGGTTVLATVVMADEDKDVNFMPLTVDYEEKFYAAGKIIGSRFIRREGRPSDEAILSGRLIDRAVRPLFNPRLRREIHVTITVLSFDEENDPDFLALNAVSAALAISDIPWNGPIAGLRLAKINDQIIFNPGLSLLADETANIRFSSFVAGREDKINMIELEANEAREEEIVEAYKQALPEIEKLIEFQREIVKALGKPKAEVALLQPGKELEQSIDEFLKDKLGEAIDSKSKAERQDKLRELKDDLLVYIEAQGFSSRDLLATELVFEEQVDKAVHRQILELNKRPDSREMDEIRELYAEAGTLPRTHGSAIFVRGNTQSLAVVTLAPPGSEQLVETMERSGKRRFMLHYNFPSYSVGETAPSRGPGRRDIGHGALAEKTLRPLLPSRDEFPYTIRVVSEILSSNGSSSMATVCAASLALMDAGVPIKKPAAGIAMGLMSNQSKGKKDQYKILTDIQGPEDHYGDMDFKVAGTDSGVNAIQMDVKIDGVHLDKIEETLEQARRARLLILAEMGKAISEPRPEISTLAPQVSYISINPSRIGEVIGPGGKIINGIIEKTGVTNIEIEQDGRVFVAGKDKEAVERAIREIKGITKEFEIGEIIEGKVFKILDFGALVDLGGGKDGLLHISELKNGFVKNVDEVVKLGDLIKVKIIRVEPDGKIALSLKQLSTP